ncbi:uncharacterized protein LOC119688289 [Teleopsis dalmanni]|uniref:uncharacterized protein LOC119688289 n=1 Tax=Teleopsis dalmanni TaxID=139649 RepID=UPI0018CCF953|nr:uncharacterized protein LOC119688289 [Teleopsis dalmanni]
MTFHPKGVINTVTTVNKEIPSPVTHLSLEQKEDGERGTTLYNITTKLCDVQSFLKKVPMLKTILNASLKQGNYSFNCPMKKGVYLMENIRISSRSPLLSLIYRPKAVYHLHGGVFEEMTDKSLLPFCAYDFYFRIVKRQCSD